MKQRDVFLVLSFLIGSSAIGLGYAEEPAQGALEQRDIQRLELTAGKSRVLDLPVAIKRASLANPEVADTVVLSPTQIYLTGKASGVTNLTLWNESGKMMGMYDVVIAPDLSRLKENLHKAFPDEKGILVTASHDYITLSGTASSAINLSRAMNIAEAYAPKKVINSMQVGGVQQVMLEVRVAEMNRELVRRLGINAATKQQMTTPHNPLTPSRCALHSVSSERVTQRQILRHILRLQIKPLPQLPITLAKRNR